MMKSLAIQRKDNPWQWYGPMLLIFVWAYFSFVVANIPDVEVSQPLSPVEVSLPETAFEPVREPDKKEIDSEPAALGGSKGETVKIHAVYEDSSQVFSWLLENGGRILLTDAQGYLLAEVDGQGRIQTARGEIGAGKLRQATADIAAFIQSPWPDKAKYGAVWWPDSLWNQILSALKPYQAQSATIAYRVMSDGLSVTIQKVVTDQGIISPNKMVSIR